MFTLLVFVLSLSCSVHCIPCHEAEAVVQRKDRTGFRINLEYISFERYHYLWDKNGIQWDIKLNMTDEGVVILGIGKQRSAYSKRATNRFAVDCDRYGVAVNCEIIGVNVSQQTINCQYTNRYQRVQYRGERFDHFYDPIFIKVHPKNYTFDGLQVTAYDRTDRLNKYRIILSTSHIKKSLFVLEFEKDNANGLQFIADMEESLYKQLDSVVDYDMDSSTSGHILWFNINGYNKYCRQPEGQTLSHEVSLTASNSQTNHLMFSVLIIGDFARPIQSLQYHNQYNDRKADISIDILDNHFDFVSIGCRHSTDRCICLLSKQRFAFDCN